MAEKSLTIKQVADLTGDAEHYIRQLCKRHEIESLLPARFPHPGGLPSALVADPDTGRILRMIPESAVLARIEKKESGVRAGGGLNDGRKALKGRFTPEQEAFITSGKLPGGAVTLKSASNYNAAKSKAKRAAKATAAAEDDDE